MAGSSRLRNVLTVDFPSQEQLENLRFYKYAAVDKSPLSQHILRHYWNWAVTLFPMWIAPNLITLLGLLFMVINVVLVAWFMPDLTSEAPSWVYFSFAAGLWLYSTFDNVDGKQARRTGTSSPLGELFDHGCDALNTTYVALLQAAALALGHTQLTVIVFLTTMAGFYLSTAEEYYTGVLYLGYVNGPTEGIVITCLAFCWSGLYGATSWHIPFTQLSSPLLAHLLGDSTPADLFVWGTFFFFVFTHCPVIFYAVYKACRSKAIDLHQAFSLAVIPIAVFCAATYYWAMSPESIVMTGQHFVLFSLAVGTLFGQLASNIILAHLTKSPFPNLLGLVAPVVIMAILVNLPSIVGIRILSPQWEYRFLWIAFVSAVTFYGVWSYLVIDGFCRHLGIRCLVIRRNKTTNPARDDAFLDSQEQGAITTALPRDQRATQPPSYSTFN